MYGIDPRFYDEDGSVDFRIVDAAVHRSRADAAHRMARAFGRAVIRCCRRIAENSIEVFTTR